MTKDHSHDREREQSPVAGDGDNAGGKRPLDRRQALKRLGLAAGVLYAAPAVLPLNDAAAQKKGGPPWQKPTRPGTSIPSAPSSPG